ncbi:glycosyltransferase family 9 protein [Thioalkalivibrio thiocyanoxidans]|uniref:glycosyltransferase family 9 protein n=1 Tax=Thioalkalivibrio thiocyanoxidans TaxID=152475 RepID=UPI000368C6D9|nr:glycosyltransferase family 9 protein [Thioalkalivibrio thiocyanoxidans]
MTAPDQPTTASATPGPPREIALLRLSALGDTTHVVPVVRSLQKAWPRTRITWIIGRLEYQLLGDLPDVEFVVVDKARGLRAYTDLRRALKGRQFDVLLQMQVSLRASLMGMQVPARRKIGFDRERARDFQWLFTQERIAARPRQHVLDSFFGFAESLGVQERELRWDIPIPDSAREWADRHLPTDRPVLVINACSSARFRNFRNWAAEHYAAVAEHAVEHHGMTVVLTGGPTELERDYGEAIASGCRHSLINLIGTTSLKQLLAVLERADAVVSPDSGPAHMANAVGTPVIGLYAGSNPERTGPYCSRQWVVNAYPEACQAAFGKPPGALRWGQRVRDPAVMDRIKVADVTAKLDALVEAKANHA